MSSSEYSETLCPTPWLRYGRNALLVAAAFSAGTGLVCLFEMTGQRPLPGTLEARKTVIAAHRAARIQEISVRPGQAVAPHDPLFQLVDSNLEDRIIAKRREIAEFEAEVVRAKATAEVDLAWRRRDLQSEIFETQLKIAALSQEKLTKQVEQLAWKEHLTSPDSNLGPMTAQTDHPFRPISLELHRPDDRRLQAMLREDAAAASTEALGTQLALCEDRLKKLETLEKELEVKIRASSGVDVAEARLEGSRSEMAAFESQAKELIMTSPGYGTVSEFKLQSGDRVPGGGTLIEILDDSQPHVVAQIPAVIASKLHSGSKVMLDFPVNERRTGTVSEVSPHTTSIIGSTESFVAVKIEPSGKLWQKLAIGSRVQVLVP